MTCKWCGTESKQFKTKEYDDQFRRDYDSGDERKMCEGCRDAVKEAIIDDRKKHRK